MTHFRLSSLNNMNLLKVWICLHLCQIVLPGKNKMLLTRLSCQDQDQDSLLVKRRNDNHSPGPVIRELVPSSHQRSDFSNTVLCIFSR